MTNKSPRHNFTAAPGLALFKSSYLIAHRPYPCICKEAVSRFESMTNKSPRHNFTTAPRLGLIYIYIYELINLNLNEIIVYCCRKEYLNLIIEMEILIL